MLDAEMTAAWREAGAVWRAVISRIVCARLKVSSRSTIKTQIPVFITVVSVYAPTFQAKADVKEKFIVDLQTTLDGICERDVLMIVCNFNPRVGSSERRNKDRTWSAVRGPHGLGKMIEAGAGLLSFCALNTHFEKKQIHKQTWQHPGSKKWHCIEYVIMRQSQRSLCGDVSV